MGDFITQIFILVLAVLTIAFIWKLFGDKLMGRETHKTAIIGKPTSDNRETSASDDGHTRIMPAWNVLYHSRRGIVEVPLVLTNNKFTIGKNKDCDLVITDSSYVGRTHAIVSHDKYGYFIVDYKSKNGMFLFGNEERKDELPITDGLCVRLANIKISFKKMDMFDNEDSDTEIPVLRRSKKPELFPTTRIAGRG